MESVSKYQQRLWQQQSFISGSSQLVESLSLPDFPPPMTLNVGCSSIYCAVAQSSESFKHHGVFLWLQKCQSCTGSKIVKKVLICTSCSLPLGSRSPFLLFWSGHLGCPVLDRHRTQRTEKRQYRTYPSLFNGSLLCLYLFYLWHLKSMFLEDCYCSV